MSTPLFRDDIMLGHNPFSSGDHLSAETDAMRDAHDADIPDVVSIIRQAMSQGVNGFVMSTHPRAVSICDALRADKALTAALNLYPVLPDIAKYAREADELGLATMVSEALSGASAMQKIGMFLKGGAGLLPRDVYSMIEILMEMELLMFKGLNIRAVFLHQTLTDLALGLGLEGVFRFYEEHIPKKFDGAVAAYGTHNLPLLLDRLQQYGITNPVIMAPFNKIGYRMQPSLAENEQCLYRHHFQLVATDTSADGTLAPEDAYSYLFRQPNVASVVVEASTEVRARETFDAIRNRLNYPPNSGESSSFRPRSVD